MADILPFIEGHSFDDETVRILGEAFDAASRSLGNTGQPALVREIIAKRIIHLAQAGERDPEQLARRALEQLGIPPEG